MEQPETGVDRPGTDYNLHLTGLDPRYRTVMRITMALGFLLFPLAPAAVLDFLLWKNDELSLGFIFVPVAALYLMLVATVPRRKFRRWGYDVDGKRLRVLHGFMWRTDTIVPFTRVQHIDVSEGPILRIFGLATLVVHTAGTHNNTVSLPGLPRDEAVALRDAIRAEIREESL